MTISKHYDEIFLPFIISDFAYCCFGIDLVLKIYMLSLCAIFCKYIAVTVQDKNVNYGVDI